jgi:hypothetical protein
MVPPGFHPATGLDISPQQLLDGEFQKKVL